MRVHAVRLGPEYLVFLLIVLFAVPQDGLAACVRSGFGADSDPSYDRHKFEHL